MLFMLEVKFYENNGSLRSFTSFTVVNIDPKEACTK